MPRILTVLGVVPLALALAACTTQPAAVATPASSGTVVTVTSTPATPTATAAASTPTAAPASAAAAGPKDATYIVEGRPVTLVNGLAEVAAAPGSASKVTTRYFGNEATGDLNKDGTPDVGFVLTQSSGGSGTFYYAVVALKTAAGYIGTNAVLLGDRIAPQTTEFRDGVLIVNYADRNAGEPMTMMPSAGMTKRLTVVAGKLVAQ